MRGTLYGVGVGPGNPELMTVKAVRIIRQADVIMVPHTGKSEQTARSIAAAYLEGKTVLSCEMPMLRDKELLASKHDAAAQRIAQLLEQGKSVAFLTLGDPSVYSTYAYVHRRVQAMGYATQIVAGVPSFCAVAAELEEPLCEGSQPLVIVPASYPGVEQCLDAPGNKVLMKTGRSMAQLKEQLTARGLAVSMVENCGLSGQRVYRSLEEIDPEAGYFSVVVAKEEPT